MPMLTGASATVNSPPFPAGTYEYPFLSFCGFEGSQIPLFDFPIDFDYLFMTSDFARKDSRRRTSITVFVAILFYWNIRFDDMDWVSENGV